MYRSAELGIPSIVIAPARSEFNDNLNTIGAATLSAQIVPYCKHPARGNDKREAWEWENN